MPWCGRVVFWRQLDQHSPGPHACRLTNASNLDTVSGVKACRGRSKQLLMAGFAVVGVNLVHLRHSGLARERSAARLQRRPIVCAVRDSHILSSSSGSASDGSDSGASGFKRSSGRLRKNDYRKFVHFFRQASPYIEGHRDKTFVVVIPGEVCNLAPVQHQALGLPQVCGTPNALGVPGSS